MRIVVEVTNRNAQYLIGEIADEHESKINAISRTRKEISLINGDVVKFISTDTRYQDGIRADVAIGSNAEIYTIASRQGRKVWEIEDLYNHIEKI